MAVPGRDGACFIHSIRRQTQKPYLGSLYCLFMGTGGFGAAAKAQVSH